MRTLRAEDIAQAVREMCIEACCVLPEDVRLLLKKARNDEISPLGIYALDKVIENYRIAEEEMVPICQDTGLTLVFVEMGQNVRIEGGLFEDAINEGVRRGYTEGYLRKSVVNDPLYGRKNSEDNTPAVIHTRIVAGDRVRIVVLPKGAGSENMSAVAMLPPSAGIEGVKAFVVDTVRKAGGNPCPPVIVGVGIGGTAEYCALLAKRALAREAGSPHADERYASLERELLEEINALGVGPQGFGGRATALSVQIETAPTHIAMLPVAVSLNCHAARHREVTL